MTPKCFIKAILLPVIMLFAFQVSFAQEKIVSGKVTDTKDGSPVAGATVTAKGTKVGTSTGADGSFRFSVPTSATTLVISSVGFGNREVAISDNMAIGLTVSTVSNLNEVVVTGYGTRRVKDVTGSVTKVSEKDFNKGQIASPEQLLQGRAAGVLVTPSTGEPGAAATINIRGTGSISGNQEPLYVVDGVPLIQGGTLSSQSGVEGSTSAKNPLIFLNPNDIESITVLKDASASAIYGSRGANGVVLITTKQGRGGKGGQFSFSAALNFAQTAKRYDLMNPNDFLQAARQANIDGGSDPDAAAEAVKAIDRGANTDWQDEIFRETVSQTYNLSWGINHKGTTARLSGSYDDQVGIVKNSGLKRLTARANVGQKFLNDKLKFETNLTYSNTKNQYAPLSNNAGYQGSLLGAALQFNPTNPVYNPDGSFFQPGDQRNPTQMLAYFDDRDGINRFLGNISGSYEIIKGLTYKIVLGYDNAQSERTAFADPRLGSNAYGGTINVFGKDYQNGILGNGRVTRQNLKTQSTLLEQYLTWDKKFNEDHTLNVVGGFSYQNFISEYDGSFGWGLNTPVVAPTDPFIKDYNNFKNYADYIPNYDKNELQSIFGRVNYIFRDKYYLTVTVRSDGSSKFGSNNRYATFPAFAVKWNVMEEKFAQKALGGIFSSLALRANYGTLGSQDNLGSYAALNLQQTWDVGSGPTTRFIQQGNPDLKWEEVTTTGVGIDLATANKRLSLSVDYFDNTRRDMLFFAPTPGGFAPTSYWWINLPGEVTNKGWEFSLNWRVIEGSKFKWDVNANMTTVKNNISGLPNPVNTGAVSGQGLSGAFAQTLTNGSPIFTWSMPVYEGFDGNGNARYANGAANQLVGTALPNLWGGLTNTFSYGRWNLMIFFSGQKGAKVYNNTANALFLKGSLRNARNVTNEAGTSPENPFNPGSVSTRFLESGDFIRLSNLNLSYAFDMKNRIIKGLTLFATGQNLALFTNYSGIDPEVNVDKNINGIPSKGFDYTQYPRPIILSFGVNMAF
jgi:TonB-dependent starch-binding outer membrane protein SusC